jgi:hypothetical protein
VSQFASVIVASQELSRLETQAVASPLPGSGPKRQKRRRGIKRRRKFYVLFFLCDRGESKMGMSRLLVFVFLLRNKTEYSYIGIAAFTKRSRCDLLAYDAVYSGW